MTREIWAEAEKNCHNNLLTRGKESVGNTRVCIHEDLFFINHINLGMCNRYLNELGVFHVKHFSSRTSFHQKCQPAYFRRLP